MSTIRSGLVAESERRCAFLFLVTGDGYLHYNFFMGVESQEGEKDELNSLS